MFAVNKIKIFTTLLFLFYSSQAASLTIDEYINDRIEELSPVYVAWIYEDNSGINYFKERANKKDSGNWALTLGAMYMNGKRVPQNYRLAWEYSMKAVEANIRGGFYNIGIMMLRKLWIFDQSEFKFDEKAFNAMDIESKLGFAYAQYAFGLMHAAGRGVKQDYITAHKWINLASAQLSEAKTVRVALERFMSPRDITAAQEIAEKWRPYKKKPK